MLFRFEVLWLYRSAVMSMNKSMKAIARVPPMHQNLLVASKGPPMLRLRGHGECFSLRHETQSPIQVVQSGIILANKNPVNGISEAIGGRKSHSFLLQGTVRFLSPP